MQSFLHLFFGVSVSVTLAATIFFFILAGRGREGAGQKALIFGGLWVTALLLTKVTNPPAQQASRDLNPPPVATAAAATGVATPENLSSSATLTTTPSSPTTPAPEETRNVISEGRFGCQNQETFRTIKDYALARDEASFNREISSALNTGECITFSTNEVVIVKAADTALGVIKVRRAGSFTEYWTGSETISY